MKKQPCPRCGRLIDEIKWDATIVRSNISEDGIVGGAVFDTVISVPPGRFTVLPCGHAVDPEAGQAIANAYCGKGE